MDHADQMCPDCEMANRYCTCDPTKVQCLCMANPAHADEFIRILRESKPTPSTER
jgi:hypothetical protein